MYFPLVFEVIRRTCFALTPAGWQVVAEYESDELASDSEDEKRLKKARETASRKRRQKDQLTSGSGKKARAAVGSDNQLFRGKKNCLQFTL